MSGIRPDAWIRRMATEHGMIEPFVDRQAREGVISYGLSSYGYDLRVSDEFKIFTNVHAAVVDPKEFDPRSFVDVQGDVCIVPPNSFALARSVEYFRIPRNVLTICVGKSTYARCFSGDTRIALVDGSSPTLEEMAARHEAREMFWGYALGPRGRIVVAFLDAPRHVGRDPLVEVTLDDGGRIRCTPDHRFLTAGGPRVAAEDLAPGTALRTFRRTAEPRREAVRPPNAAGREWIDSAGAAPVAVVDPPAGRVDDERSRSVQSIRPLPGEHDVYCLTVPEAGNFALASGVLVENCGIIVNVTPFEPEWEGHVTLEISNTTPLPAKIYAREGLAQVLFFESDEPCEVSYRERGGKYQSQRGVTLPRL